METLIGLIIAVSIAAERLVEILKSYIPYLRDKKAVSVEEVRRQAALHVVALVASVVTAMLARPIILDAAPEGWKNDVTVLAIGLLASGGAGLWNSVLGYVYQAKNLKKAEATKSP